MFSWAIALSAQSPLLKQWDYRYGGTLGDFLKAVIKTSDHGLLMGGESQSDSSGDKSQNRVGAWNAPDLWIVKVDSLGIKQWDKTYGGNRAVTFGALLELKDGGYLCGGGVTADSGYDVSEPNRGNVGSSDFWLLKLDLLGNKVWDRRFGGDGGEFLTSMLEMHNGFVLLGRSSSGVSGDKSEPNWDQNLTTADYWILKVDFAGNKVWDKRYGGFLNDYPNKIIQTEEGGYIIAGNSWSHREGDVTEEAYDTSSHLPDYWIVKIDSMGNKLWDKRYGGLGAEYFSSICTNSNNGFLVGGISYSGISGVKAVENHDSSLSSNTADFWVLEIDRLGNIIWQKTYGGYANEDEFCDISRTADCGYLLSGTSYSHIGGDKSEENLGNEQSWFIKIDSVGNRVWDKTLRTNIGLGDNENGFAIQMSDFSYVMGNYTGGPSGGDKTQDSQGGADYWISKYVDINFIKCVETNGGDTLPIVDELLIFPNPVLSELTVKLTSVKLNSISLNIYDVLGQVVYRFSDVNLSKSFTKVIDLSALANGIYFLVIKVNDDQFIKKILKQ